MSLHAVDELDPLSPAPAEIAAGVLTVLHLALLLVVVVQNLRGKAPVPFGIFGLIVLVLVPVAGPLLVLTWPGRVERHRRRARA